MLVTASVVFAMFLPPSSTRAIPPDRILGSEPITISVGHEGTSIAILEHRSAAGLCRFDTITRRLEFNGTQSAVPLAIGSLTEPPERMRCGTERTAMISEAGDYILITLGTRAIEHRRIEISDNIVGNAYAISLSDIIGTGTMNRMVNWAISNDGLELYILNRVGRLHSLSLEERGRQPTEIDIRQQFQLPPDIATPQMSHSNGTIYMFQRNTDRVIMGNFQPDQALDRYQQPRQIILSERLGNEAAFSEEHARIVIVDGTRILQIRGDDSVNLLQR